MRLALRSFVVILLPNGGPWGTVPELLFEKKGLIPALQQLIISQPKRIE